MRRIIAGLEFPEFDVINLTRIFPFKLDTFQFCFNIQFFQTKMNLEEDGIDVETEGFDCGRCSIFDVVICRQIALEMASNG